MSQYVTLKLKRGTSTEWSTTNPTLAVGEPGFETDSGNMKIGDGIATWTNLPYLNTSGGTGPTGDTGATGYNFSLPSNSVLWTPDGTSITGTVGLQYASGVGITIDVLNIRSLSSISIGNNAGQTGQRSSSIAIGNGSGVINQQEESIAIGTQTGLDNQRSRAVAIGTFAGRFNQGEYSIAIGGYAGESDQGGVTGGAIAIGALAGQIGQQSASLAIGGGAGYNNQQANSVAIGTFAGQIDQGANSVAIGAFAGQANQAANTIILNASGIALNGNVNVTGCFYVKPIRSIVNGSLPSGFFNMAYNPTTSEIIYWS